MARYVGALDQGTTSTRFMVFDQRRQRDRPPPARTPADPAAARLGRARSARDRRAQRRGDRARDAQRQHHRGAISPPSASPTSARRPSSGTRRPGKPWYNAIVWQDTRTDRIINALDRSAQAQIDPLAHRAAARDLFLRREDPVDPRQRPRRARRGGARRGGLRQPRHVGDLEPDRRQGRRRARHRRHQRQPDDADGPRRRCEWDDELLRDLRRSRARCCPRSRRRPTARRSASRDATGRSAARCRSPATSAISRPRPSARSASAPGEAKNTYGTGNFMLLNTGTQDRPVEGRAADDGVLPDGRRNDLRARRIDRGHRIRRAVAARPARDHRVGVGDRGARQLGARQRRRLLRAGVLGPVRARTGDPTRAARSSACRASTPRRTSRARRSKRSASRRAPSSTRWSRTPASASRCSRWTAARRSTTR